MSTPDYTLLALERAMKESNRLRRENERLMQENAKLHDEQAPITLKESMSDWRAVIEPPASYPSDDTHRLVIYTPDNEAETSVRTGVSQLVKFAQEILERYGKGEDNEHR